MLAQKNKHDGGTAMARPQAANADSDKTGLPPQLKRKIEEGSGISMESLRIHYSSDVPQQLHAAAFTMSDHVYLGPGKESLLFHELGHVVQQRRSGVSPNGLRGELPARVDPAMERAADAIGGAIARGEPVQANAETAVGAPCAMGMWEPPEDWDEFDNIPPQPNIRLPPELQAKYEAMSSSGQRQQTRNTQLSPILGGGYGMTPILPSPPPGTGPFTGYDEDDARVEDEEYSPFRVNYANLCVLEDQSGFGDHCVPDTKVTVTMTGGRSGDKQAARQEMQTRGFGLPNESGEAWHHWHDFNEGTQQCTMVLVDESYHSSLGHKGACSQYGHWKRQNGEPSFRYK